MHALKGDIFSIEAYAQGKMLNHSSWNGILPRNGMPSDIDAVLDNNGDLLMIELSSNCEQWFHLSFGQRTLYENLVRAGQGKIMAVLCRQVTPPGEKIDTVKNVVSFQPMWWDKDIIIGKVYPGEKWITYVQKWWNKLL